MRTIAVVVETGRRPFSWLSRLNILRCLEVSLEIANAYSLIERVPSVVLSISSLSHLSRDESRWKERESRNVRRSRFDNWRRQTSTKWRAAKGKPPARACLPVHNS
jgi:hypothetical protein